MEPAPRRCSGGRRRSSRDPISARAEGQHASAGDPLASQGSKTSRALAVTPLVESGRLTYSLGDWNAEFLEEFCSFPSAPHDDQVDAVVMALSYLSRQSVSVEYVRELFGLCSANH